MKLTKIYAGEYEVRVKGVLVRVSKNEDSNTWFIAHGVYGSPEYWSDTVDTLKEARALLREEE